VRRVLLAVTALAGIALALLAVQAAWDASVFDLGPLARRTPARTALMRQRLEQAKRDGQRLRIDQRTVPYSAISPLLRRAILIAEDDGFFSHAGLDWNGIRDAARKNLEAGRVVRGGSTVTQQLAKNLYLGEERTPVRKLREVFLALRLERTLSKRRIFELYLNLIEWGNGIFGVEAAARRYFGVPASELDPRQACLLAAMITNPRRESPLHPSRRLERRVRMIASRLRGRGVLDEEQYEVAIGTRSAEPEPSLFDWLFGRTPKPKPEPEPDTSVSDSEAMVPDTTEAPAP
jgi:monofunctional glycosyltransferase